MVTSKNLSGAAEITRPQALRVSGAGYNRTDQHHGDGWLLDGRRTSGWTWCLLTTRNWVVLVTWLSI